MTHCTGIHHPALVVPDLDAAIDFYTQALGAELVKRAAWEPGNEMFDALTGIENSSAQFCLLRFGHSYLEIFAYASSRDDAASNPKADELGIRHLAFEVSAIDEAVEQTKNHGGTTLGKTVHVPGGGSACYCRDPFGNIIELLVPGGKMPDLRTDRPENERTP